MINRMCGCLIAFITSVVLGIIIGALYFTAVISAITTALWISLGIAGVALVLFTLILLFARREAETCIISNGPCLVTGIIGTIVSLLIAFTVTLATGTVVSAVIVGFVAFFVFLTILSLLQLLLCLIFRR